MSSRKLSEPRKQVEGECWIRTSEGDEPVLYLNEDDIQCRLGHEVSLTCLEHHQRNFVCRDVEKLIR